MSKSPASRSASILSLNWQVLLPAGPALANHVGCILDNHFYIHGGVTQHRSITPSNKLYCLSLDTLIWNEVRAPGSPALSHHCCVSMDNRYMLLIGGWNGHQRVTKVYAFDTQTQDWLVMKDTGFPEGAGLSSHAVCVLTNGDILIIGREGCLRPNQKHGHVYLLSGTIDSGEFTYTKIMENANSRSGHTLNGSSNSMYIVGGRTDDLIELFEGFHAKVPLGKLNSSFIALSKQLHPLERMPKGRKNHVIIAGNHGFLIHGGETFDGKCRQAVGEMYLVITKPQLAYYRIEHHPVPRAAHVCVCTGDRVIFHGGVAWKDVVYGDCYELCLTTD